MIVKFNDPKEFGRELDEDCLRGDAPDILRLTKETRPSGYSPNVVYLTVIATFKNHDNDVVRLEDYAGELWGNANIDDPVIKKSEEDVAFIEKVCKRLKVQVRAGVFIP